MQREQIPGGRVWPVYEKHVMLDRGQEATEHLPSPLCWCCPRLEYVDPETGNEVWVHHEPH
jgi:hypothetical protein